MRQTMFFSRRAAIIAALVGILAVVAVAVAFEPLTHEVAANQFVCFGCHQVAEYDPDEPGSPSRIHKATPEGGAATCAECHVPPGWAESALVYAHYIFDTDLYGHAHDQRVERHGAAVTPIAFKAYMVRDRLLEYDSSPCRTCHIEEEIKPKRKRGQKAHAKALEDKTTCIECHYNLVHREVDPRLEFGE